MVFYMLLRKGYYLVILLLYVSVSTAEEPSRQGKPGADSENEVMQLLPLKVTDERVAPYVLLQNGSSGKWFLKDAKAIPDDISTTGNGVIWLNQGLRNYQIRSISGNDITEKTASTSIIELVFSGKYEPLLMTLVSRNGNVVVAEAYVRRGGWQATDAPRK